MLRQTFTIRIMWFWFFSKTEIPDLVPIIVTNIFLNIIVLTFVMITLCMWGIACAAVAPFVQNDVKSYEATNTAIYTNKKSYKCKLKSCAETHTKQCCVNIHTQRKACNLYMYPISWPWCIDVGVWVVGEMTVTNTNVGVSAHLSNIYKYK